MQLVDKKDLKSSGLMQAHYDLEVIQSEMEAFQE
jgi:hypothetical protein